MNFKELFEDEDAVSPVIGVILMVAITVILAAVIGTFVLGLGDQVQQSAPTAQFSFDYDSSNTDLTVTHDGGDGIEAQYLSFSGDVGGGTNAEITNSGDTWGSASGYGSTSSITAGDSVIVGVNSGDATIRVIWSSSEGDRTSTLAQWEE